MSDSSSSHCLRARWIFPVDGPPIEDGVITIENGRIASLNSGSHGDATDMGNVAIIPGLVNAHTHLEFSDLTAPLTPSQPFPAWVRTLMRQRQQRADDRDKAIKTGLTEAATTGSTLLGEIATDDITDCRFSQETPQGVIFRELLGIADDVCAERLQIAEQYLGRESYTNRSDAVRGLSPHAPYSLAEGFFRQLVDLAVKNNAPVAMHVAETREELELLQRGTGLLTDMLKDFGVWRDRFWMPGGSISEYLNELARAPIALVVHGNYLIDKEIEFLSTQPHMTVVYCPRTHHFFGHQNHPWQRLIERGANVALGTDSRASNPDLSLWRELQFLAASNPEVTVTTLLELATINGACALGMGENTGTLTPGKLADLTVIGSSDGMSGNSSAGEGISMIIPSQSVLATMRGGRWIHR